MQQLERLQQQLEALNSLMGQLEGATGGRPARPNALVDILGGVTANEIAPSTSANCRPTQFECANGVCIPESFVGDGDNDCGDSSDEASAANSTCRDEHFTCANGRCIRASYVNDGDNDCGDQSDEHARTCRASEFRCANNRCIQNNWVGDGDNDCGDNSDETQESTCTSIQLTCTNSNRCLPISFQCDTDNDCGDNSDESNCPATKSLQEAKKSMTNPGGDAKSPNYEAKRLAAKYLKSKSINKIHAGQKKRLSLKVKQLMKSLAKNT